MTKIKLTGDNIHSLLQLSTNLNLELNFRTFLNDSTKLDEVTKLVNNGNLLVWCYIIDDANKLAEFNIISRNEKDFSNTSKYDKLKNLPHIRILDQSIIKGHGEYLSRCIKETTNIKVLYSKDENTKELYTFYDYIVHNKKYSPKLDFMLYVSTLTIPYESLNDLVQNCFSLWTKFDNLGSLLIDDFMITR